MGAHPSGTASRSAGKRREGLDLLGPLGRGFHLDSKAKRVLLVAGGMGVAPLAFLAQRAREGGLETTLLLGARTKERLYPLELLPPGLDTVVATEGGRFGP